MAQDRILVPKTELLEIRSRLHQQSSRLLKIAHRAKDRNLIEIAGELDALASCVTSPIRKRTAARSLATQTLNKS